MKHPLPHHSSPVWTKLLLLRGKWQCGLLGRTSTLQQSPKNKCLVQPYSNSPKTSVWFNPTAVNLLKTSVWFNPTAGNLQQWSVHTITLQNSWPARQRHVAEYTIFCILSIKERLCLRIVGMIESIDKKIAHILNESFSWH